MWRRGGGGAGVFICLLFAFQRGEPKDAFGKLIGLPLDSVK